MLFLAHGRIGPFSRRLQMTATCAASEIFWGRLKRGKSPCGGRRRRSIRQAAARHTFLTLEPLEERHVLSGGLFSVVIDGLDGATDEEKVAAAQNLFQSAGLSDQQIVALGVVDPNERILVQVPIDASVEDLDQELATVPGYSDVSDFDP